MIKILGSSLNRLGVIKKTISCSRLEELNGENVLDFEAVLDAKLNGLIDESTIFELDEDYFDLAFLKKSVNEDGTHTIEVEAEHVSYRLNDPLYNVEYFTELGTPSYILGKILEDTGFTVGSVDFAEEVTYSAQEAKSRRQLAMEFVTYLGGEVRFDKFEIDILEQRGSLETKPLIKDRNVKVVSKSTNKRKQDSEGNPLVSYICEPIHLPGDIYNLGDNVRLIQRDLDINEELRVVRINRDPYNEAKVTFVFANYTDGLESHLYRIAMSTVVKDKIYNGTRIGPEYGFENVRSDKKARSYFRSDGMAFQKGDGSGENWDNRFWFDEEGGVNLIGKITVLGGNAETVSGAQEKADAAAYGKSRIFTTTDSPNSYFLQSTLPSFDRTHPTTPYSIGDLWVEGPTGNIYNCKTEKLTGPYQAEHWELASKYTDDTAADAAQLDADAAQLTADTAVGNAAIALERLDDIASDEKVTPVEKLRAEEKWDLIFDEYTGIISQATIFNVSNTDYTNAYNDLYTYLNITLDLFGDINATTDIVRATWLSTWENYYDERTNLLNDISAKTKELADAAQSTADVKRRVFVETPTAPYDVGDLWMQGEEGDILRCAISKSEGQAYDITDWVKTSKYTDDTNLNSFVDSVYNPEIENLEGLIDGKIVTWFYSHIPTLENLPASEWTTEDIPKHKNDLFYDTTPGLAYRFEGSNAVYKEGMEAVEFVEGYSDNTGTLSKESDHLFLSTFSDVSIYAAIRTYVIDEPIDLTNVNEITVDWELSGYGTYNLYYAKLCVSTIKMGSLGDYDKSLEINGDNPRTEQVLDVSDLSGEYYLRLHSSVSFNDSLSEVKVYNLKIDKDISFNWEEIEDAKTIQALAAASTAQITANNKMRVFVVEPAPPYDIGDLWVQGEEGDILRCAISKSEGQAYDITDWVKTSKYTDDTKIDDLLDLEGKIPLAKLGNTIMEGGYLKTNLIDVDDIFTTTAIIKSVLTVGEAGDIILDGVNKRIYMDEDNYWDSTGIHMEAANISGEITASILDAATGTFLTLVAGDTTGARLEMGEDEGDPFLDMYDDDDELRVHLEKEYLNFYNEDGVKSGYVRGHKTSGNLNILELYAQARAILMGGDEANMEAGGWSIGCVGGLYGTNYVIGSIEMWSNAWVNGSLSVDGHLTKGSGTFEIDHPLEPLDKTLIHGFVEAPRYDLLYRGTVTLKEGKAEVDIDTASNMTTGTFDTLTQNAEVVSLCNLSGYSRVRSMPIDQGRFLVVSEDKNSSDKINWLVVAERADEWITENETAFTDKEGRLIPEHNKPDDSRVRLGRHEKLIQEYGLDITQALSKSKGYSRLTGYDKAQKAEEIRRGLRGKTDTAATGDNHQ